MRIIYKLRGQGARGGTLNAAPEKRVLHLKHTGHYVYAADDIERRLRWRLSYARRSCCSSEWQLK